MSERMSNGRASTRPRREPGYRSNGARPDGRVTQEARDRVARAMRGPSLDLGLALRTVAGVAAAGVAGIAERAQRAVPPADLDERDPDYIRESLPGLWMLASLYFRAEVRGLSRIPEEGPVLLVGNHSGGNLTPDTGVFTLAFNT